MNFRVLREKFKAIKSEFDNTNEPGLHVIRIDDEITFLDFIDFFIKDRRRTLKTYVHERYHLDTAKKIETNGLFGLKVEFTRSPSLGILLKVNRLSENVIQKQAVACVDFDLDVGTSKDLVLATRLSVSLGLGVIENQKHKLSDSVDRDDTWLTLTDRFKLIEILNEIDLFSDEYTLLLLEKYTDLLVNHGIDWKSEIKIKAFDSFALDGDALTLAVDSRIKYLESKYGNLKEIDIFEPLKIINESDEDRLYRNNNNEAFRLDGLDYTVEETGSIN